MRKVSNVFFILLFLFSLIPAAQETPKPENPKKAAMDSFMGLKWGENVLRFLELFQHQKELRMMTPKVPNLLSYRLKNYKVFDDATATVETIYFYWYPNSKKRVKAKKKNFDKYFLREIELEITPAQFDLFFARFKENYGEPDRYAEFEVQDQQGARHLQKKAMWVNETLKRKLYMDKFHDTLTKGFIKFMPTQSPWSR
ncbi:MAG: hypothetical protein GY940_31840 [bacterium]|nr:hypothetical protein [bacterium]